MTKTMEEKVALVTGSAMGYRTRLRRSLRQGWIHNRIGRHP